MTSRWDKLNGDKYFRLMRGLEATSGLSQCEMAQALGALLRHKLLLECPDRLRLGQDSSLQPKPKQVWLCLPQGLRTRNA